MLSKLLDLLEQLMIGIFLIKLTQYEKTGTVKKIISLHNLKIEHQLACNAPPVFRIFDNP